MGLKLLPPPSESAPEHPICKKAGILSGLVSALKS